MLALANRTIVSLRKSASALSGLEDEVLYGMRVEILSTVPSEDENDNSQWCHVRTHYRYEGYCRLDELVIEDAVTAFEQGNLKIIMQPYADILSEPKVQGICLQSIPRGGRICVTGNVAEHEGWVKVALVDGRIGYTKEKYIGEYYPEPFTTDEETFRKRVVEMAKLYLGTQYRWGGKSPLGIDCSGMTSMSYMLCGVMIYRDASIKEGFPVKEIPFENKKPGDLLYFPGHIAMYMGDDMYIHSTGRNGSDGVVINSLDPKHELYREDLVKSLKYVGSIFPL
ncbi:MAG: C40 family peptidase [Lachnospiraceae bacterium]|nr:C40 family peptidase [Lachnospiraceae bacterium]